MAACVRRPAWVMVQRHVAHDGLGLARSKCISVRVPAFFSPHARCWIPLSQDAGNRSQDQFQDAKLPQATAQGAQRHGAPIPSRR